MPIIEAISSADLRYSLPHGAGSDAVHVDPQYCLAVTRIRCGKLCGTGFALTLGYGNKLVCEAIDMLSAQLVGKDLEELMSKFGEVTRAMADDPVLRWLGPHKGVVHLALASIVNACFDLWALSRDLPLWKLLLELSPEQIANLLDLSYIEDVIDRQEAIDLLQSNVTGRGLRSSIIARGYPGYDTSVGWMAYDDSKVRELTKKAMDRGFHAFKLKVGSADHTRDLRRASMLRESIGEGGTLMFDANQRWSLPEARTMCRQLASYLPLWIEEPTHPDDIQAHVELAQLISPVRIAAGEHMPNRVIFKNFMQSGGIQFVQADCTRLAGVSEFLAVSLMAKKFGLPVVPHVGDMGQVHQHLVLFNHVALNHDIQFLEHIPHLRQYFSQPAEVEDGLYRTPLLPGASTGLKELES
ncbi:MAG: enolase C-terminal domain-like protein [Edaphobacter sp.]|uniref:enolase C-terminal domain-like protein n=1 Tax=Edaphobacter sp. TaxID=1934404 RepID=UPI002393A62F|nr:enolase C-terminal domain-like protein [Edaphobacter sp.]MDE1177517.1 enolase C-terminal domain-like protein [Edaphobacter sp.]